MTCYEYALTMNNGEELEFCEFNEEATPELQNNMIRSKISHILDKCSYIPRFAIEEAKRGTTTNFQIYLKTPPQGSLMKLNLNCSELWQGCPIADRQRCRTGFFNQKSLIFEFPVCWTATIDSSKISAQEHIEAIHFANRIINAWKENKYVIICGDT